MHGRRLLPSDWLTPLELTLLGAIWGASFLFMRIAAADFGAFALVEIRLALGALILLPFTWRSRALLARAGWWRLAAGAHQRQLLLGETLSATMALAGCLILGGVALSQQRTR